MKARLCLLVVLLALVALVSGCYTTPPDKIQKSITIINAGVTDYTTFAQPLISAKVQAMNDEMNKEEDPEKKAALAKKVKDGIEYFKLGNEIPPTLQELEDWALGKPLPDKKDDS